ncbi:MAG: hypothetical protein ACFNLY_01930 [Selenomonas noxia]
MMHAVAVLRVLIARQMGGIMQALVTPYRAVTFLISATPSQEGHIPLL